MRNRHATPLMAICLASGFLGGCMNTPLQATNPTGETGGINTTITLPAQQRSTQAFNASAINSLRIELLDTHDNSPLNNYVSDPTRPGKRLIAFANRTSSASSSIHVSFPAVPVGNYMIRVTTSPYYIQNLKSSEMMSDGVVDNTLITVGDLKLGTGYMGVLPQTSPSLYAGTAIRPETDLDRTDTSGSSKITISNVQLDGMKEDLNGNGIIGDNIDLDGDGDYSGIDLNGDGLINSTASFAITGTTSIAVLPENKVEEYAELFTQYLFTDTNNGLKLTTPSFLEPNGSLAKTSGYGIGNGTVTVAPGQISGVAVRVLSTTTPTGLGNIATLGKKCYTTSTPGANKYLISIVTEGSDNRINGNLVQGSDAYIFPSWASWSIGVQYIPNTLSNPTTPSRIGNFAANADGNYIYTDTATHSIGANTQADIVLYNESNVPVVSLGRISNLALGNDQAFTRLTTAEAANLQEFQASFDSSGYLREVSGVVTDLPPILASGYVYKVFREYQGADGDFGDNSQAGVSKLEDNLYTQFGTLYFINANISVILPSTINKVFNKTDALGPGARLVIGIAKTDEEKPLAVFYKQTGTISFN